MSTWRCMEPDCEAHGEQPTRKAAVRALEHHILVAHNDPRF